MTRIHRGTLGISCLAVGALVAAACGQTSQPKKEVLQIDSRTAAFSELSPGVTRALLWGDADAGPHGAFVKFAPATQNALHTHTNDIRIVVLEGAYLYTPENGQERRITAGHYLFLPGGDRHLSGGDATQGALFYHESPGKFDLTAIK